MVEVGRIEDWTIIVCSRDAEPVIITIPSQHTVLQLKEQIEKEMSIPVSEQKALYYQEKPLLDDRCLSDCEGMRNGSAVMVARKPFIIHVYRNDIDVTKTVEAPAFDVQSWSIGNLHDYILTKVGVPTYVPHILAFKNFKIESSNESKVSENYLVYSGCHMTLTLIQLVHYERLHMVR